MSENRMTTTSGVNMSRSAAATAAHRNLGRSKPSYWGPRHADPTVPSTTSRVSRPAARREPRRESSVTSATPVNRPPRSTTVSAEPNGIEPVPGELLGDQVADHALVRPAEELRRREISQRREEREQRPADDATGRSRQRDVEERLPRTAVEILAGVDQLRVQIAERRIDGQDREWQIAVHEPGDHGRGAGDELLAPDADVDEHRVDEAVGVEDRRPCVDPDQVVDDPGENDRRDDELVPAAGEARGEIRQRIAERRCR